MRPGKSPPRMPAGRRNVIAANHTSHTNLRDLSCLQPCAPVMGVRIDASLSLRRRRSNVVGSGAYEGTQELERNALARVVGVNHIAQRE